jgi:tetratricopeptide (TPR) repeat protein
LSIIQDIRTGSDITKLSEIALKGGKKNMEKKYKTLRIIASFYRVLAYILLLIGVIAVVAVAGRDGGGGAIIGVIIVAVITIGLLAASESILVFLDIEENTRKEDPRDSKLCPNCGEHVKYEVKICRFCGHKFDVDYQELAKRYKEKEMIPEAIAMYEQYLKINPNDADAYEDLGVLYEKEEEYEKEIENYKRAIQINPAYSDLYREIGLSYEGLGKNEKAIEAFEQYKKLNPEADDISEMEDKIESLREEA